MAEEIDLFIRPQTTSQRQYEVLRAIFVEKIRVREVASRFGYTEHAVRSIVRDFKRNPTVEPFFAVRTPGRRPVEDPTRNEIIQLRKQNYSIYDIEQLLEQQGAPLSYRVLRGCSKMKVSLHSLAAWAKSA